MKIFGGPNANTRELILKKASADPRNSLNGCHHNVLEAFEQVGRRVSLRTFSWEEPGAHRYQDCARP